MTKYKDLKQEEKEFVDFYQMKWVRIIGFLAFLGLGVWMLIDPTPPRHQSVERATVALFKELWSMPFGVILVSVGLIGISYFMMQLIKLKKYVWIKLENGYYLFHKQRRVSGLKSMYNGNNLIVFYPEQSTVLEFKDYLKSPFYTYQKASETNLFGNDNAYWMADNEGYVLIYKGKHLSNTSSEFRGDDLIVKCPDTFRTFHLKNYRNLKDGQIRQASMA